jgi:hypothetical protein
MANDNKSNDGGKNDKKNGEVKVPARGWILLMAVIAFIPLLMMVRNQAETKFHPLRPNEFLEKVDANQILPGRLRFNHDRLKFRKSRASIRGQDKPSNSVQN